MRIPNIRTRPAVVSTVRLNPRSKKCGCMFQITPASFIHRSAGFREDSVLTNPRTPMTMSSRFIAIVAASLLLGGTAFAQTTAPATSAPGSAMAPAAKKAQKPHTAASLECSKEADAKGLHGKERKKFRSECKAKAAKPN
jgi:hypothetical protein